MKRLLFSLLFLFPFIASAQSFYVEKTEKGFEKSIIEKLDFNGYKLVDKAELSDYVITYHYQKNNRNKKFEGYIKVSDKTGKQVYKTDLVKKSANAFNGYQAMPAVISEIVEKQLLPQLKKGLI